MPRIRPMKFVHVDDWLASLRAGTPASEFLVRRNDEPASPIRGSFAS
jgi:hypothetical protein